VPDRLVDRRPEVPADTLIAGLVPPPLFTEVRFSTYRPDPAEPTQGEASARLQRFVAGIDSEANVGRGSRASRFRRTKARAGPAGIYLDGGFGVGKTHLLASAWHAAPAPKAYATFVELTQLAGTLGFHRLVEELSGMRLLAIDEFELDDPGDTVLISTLLARLDEAGVKLAATSNTLPDRLGEDRFAADDFMREIQAMSARFVAIRVDGPDFRHRDLPAPPPPPTAEEVRQAIYTASELASSELASSELASSESATGSVATLDDFGELLEHLAQLHPSRYGALLDGLTLVGLTDVHAAPNQNVALRLVVLADRLYDRQIPLLAAGLPLDQLFSAEMLAGGYRKKYRRAISRLIALARLAAAARPSE
jgi:cell division protein ZapE